MRLIQSHDVNDAFINVMEALYNGGVAKAPRGLATLELPDAWLTIHNVANPVISVPERKLDLNYLKAEMDWYRSGDLSIAEIGKHASMWRRIANPDGTVNSNYGYLATHAKHEGKSQLEWCIDALKKDPDSRQAVINYNQPRHKYDGNKDFVCTLNQAFTKRDGKLDTIVMMRSNDLVYGFSYDVPWFAGLQQQGSSATGIPVGKYHHYATSMHIYEKHFPMMREVVDKYRPQAEYNR